MAPICAQPHNITTTSVLKLSLFRVISAMVPKGPRIRFAAMPIPRKARTCRMQTADHMRRKYSFPSLFLVVSRTPTQPSHRREEWCRPIEALYPLMTLKFAYQLRDAEISARWRNIKIITEGTPMSDTQSANGNGFTLYSPAENAFRACLLSLVIMCSRLIGLD